LSEYEFDSSSNNKTIEQGHLLLKFSLLSVSQGIVIDGSPNAVGEKFVAAKYSSGKVLSLHNFFNFTIHFIDGCRKFIRYGLVKGLRRIYICILFIVSFSWFGAGVKQVSCFLVQVSFNNTRRSYFQIV
jgi:hypothetical protein